jgi:hypothetical protein
MKKELSAGTKNEQQTTADSGTSASLEQNGLLGAVENFKPIPLPVSFLEWVSFEGYLRLSEKAGHKWFKPGITETYTTIELYELFIKEVEDEIHATLCEEYNKQLEYESEKLNTL